jgi:nucleotide-binding universal stress UspA family protein
MLSIKKILLPVDFPNPLLPVLHQAATLARQFHSEILLLHVVTAASRAAGVPVDGPKLAGWDLVGEILREAREKSDQRLGPELEGLPIRSMLADGDAAQAIIQAAQQEKVDLIMIPSHGFTFNKFLLGSVSAKVLHGTGCPVWTGAQSEETQLETFAIRKVLCAVDFGSHGERAVSWARQVAAEFGAHLTLAHVTPGVELWGPGGSYVNPRWKDELLSDAERHMTELQKKMDLDAEVFIAGGSVSKVLSEATERFKADLLVTGCHPYGNQMRTHCYAIIRSVPVPVLSV